MQKIKDILIITTCVILIWTFGIVPAYMALSIEAETSRIERAQAAEEDQAEKERRARMSARITLGFEKFDEYEDLIRGTSIKITDLTSALADLREEFIKDGKSAAEYNEAAADLFDEYLATAKRVAR